MELDLRKQKVLAAIVESYIATGEPVGSRALAEAFRMSVSSATLRNEMAALAELGYLEQPHTSSGRVPSHLGFRFYIDRLMNKKPLSEDEKQGIDELFRDAEPNPNAILEEAGQVLADKTGCAAISTTPTSHGGVTAHIELVPTGRKLYLLLFLTSAGVVKHRICRIEFEITPEAVGRFVLIINERLSAVPVEDITPAFIQTLAAGTGEYALSFSPVLFALYELARETCSGQLIVEGQNNLLLHNELITAARDLLGFLSREDELLTLLAAGSNSLSVLLGKELQKNELSDIGIIITRYHFGTNAGGSIGVVGPARIDYARIIPYIEYLALSLGRLLSDTFDEQ
ncbi:MAG: heat-inducible transcriptional repressor HrcA [Acetanaerobacterium sp.]